MSGVNSFSPTAASAPLAATNVSSRVALPGSVGHAMKVYNGGTTVVYVKAGDSTVTATTTDNPIPPGGEEVVSIPEHITHVAAIYGTGTGAVAFTRGDGV